MTRISCARNPRRTALPAQYRQIIYKQRVMKAQHQAAFQQEIQELLHSRAFAILWVGAILIPLFSILDFFTVPQHFSQFLLWRLAAALVFLILLFLNKRDRQHKHPFAIVTTSYFVAGITIIAMTIRMGGYESYYFVGLILVLVTYAAIFPLTSKQTACLGSLLLLMYGAPILFLSPPSPSSFKIFYSNFFFLISFLIFVVIQSKAETQMRKEEFTLRMAEKDATSQLAFYADKLEEDVEIRTRELEETESRYRELYENIIDDVLLVDSAGTILMANPQFFKRMDRSAPVGNVSLYDFIHPADTAAVQTLLFDKLRQGKNVTDFQFRLKKEDDSAQVIDMECTATIIKKEETLVGFQMLLRDITTRKRLEQELLSTLQTVQQTRNVTILGLAKLAEYRHTHDENHLERMREYCQILVKALAQKPEYQQLITSQYIDDLYHSSILHDIGQVGIPDNILRKGDALTEQEKDHIKQHPIFGGDTLKAVDIHATGQSYLAMGKNIAYFHHERWDGSGYPYGLKQEEIPLAARIVALADTYDELTTTRPVKPAYSHEDAVKVLTTEQRHLFAPDLIDAFIAHNSEFKQIRIHFPEKKLSSERQKEEK